MRRLAAYSVSVVACLAAGLGGQSPTTPQGPPVFRTSVDLIHFDVSVLDKARKPVRGLTAADFTVLEDGKPQPIVAFSAVDVPEPVRPTATWMAEVAPDVQTNEVAASPEGRLFVALIDDALIPADPWMLKKAREIAHGVIDRLSPHDQLAIVFSSTSNSVQSFTQDRARLRKAVDTTTIGFATYKLGWDTALRTRTGFGPPIIDGDMRLRDASMKTLEMVAETLIAAPQRRKALIFISPGITVDVASAAMPVQISRADSGGSMAILEAGRTLVDKMPRLFSEMQKANVTLYPVDPSGLGGLAAYVQGAALSTPALQGGSASPSVPADYNWLAPKGPPPPMALAQHVATISADFNLAAASNTGGITVMNTNEFDTGLNKIFNENNSYYLLGYRAPAKNAAKSLHRVSVKVNRPDTFVRTRNQYETAPPEAPDAKSGTAPLRNLMAGPVPVADLPLSVAASPVAVRDRKDAAVLIVLGLQQPAATSRQQQTIEYQISAFTPDGRPVGTGLRQTATLAISPSATSIARYELLTQLPLPPGRYDLRIATRRSSDGVPGSLYTTIDVPNFQDAPLSLSGVSIEARPAISGGPRDAFASLIPFVPTAVREFRPRDVVTAHFRMYQGGRDRLAPVALRARVISDLDQTVADAAGTLGVERFDPATRSVDHRFALPISSLAPGEYLLTFEASLDKTVVRRDVRFRIR